MVVQVKKHGHVAVNLAREAGDNDAANSVNSSSRRGASEMTSAEGVRRLYCELRCHSLRHLLLRFWVTWIFTSWVKGITGDSGRCSAHN